MFSAFQVGRKLKNIDNLEDLSRMKISGRFRTLCDREVSSLRLVVAPQR